MPKLIRLCFGPVSWKGALEKSVGDSKWLHALLEPGMPVPCCGLGWTVLSAL